MSTKKHILIVEDEEAFRLPLTRILEHEGYSVAAVGSSKEALSAAAQGKIDLVVTDVKIPGDIDGLEIITRIKGLGLKRDPLFIVMTGYAGDDAPLRALRAGVGDFLYKPFESEQFLYSVKKTLRMRELEDQRVEHIERIEKMKGELETYNLKLADMVKEKTDTLQTIFHIGREINSSLQLPEVLSTILERTAAVLNADVCSVLLVDDIKRDLFIAAAKGIPREVVENTRLNYSSELASWLTGVSGPIVVGAGGSGVNFDHGRAQKFYGDSFVGAPLIFKGKPVGIITVNHKKSGQPFHDEDIRFIHSIADHAAVAIANAKLYSELKGVYLQVITALNSIIELKDNYTKTHSERVTRYAVMVGRSMHMSDPEVETLRMACQLHDLGKIGVHDHVLTKTGRLNADEWEEIRQHPAKGVEILKPLSFLTEVIALVEQHHEWYNGKGYPHGLKGDQIDLRARIMAVVDSFDAMTTKRSYSPALTVDDACSELVRCSGTQFDPDIVSVFLEIVRNTPDIVTHV